MRSEKSGASGSYVRRIFLLVLILAVCTVCIFQAAKAKTARELCEAIEAGDNSRLELLLQNDPDVNQGKHTILFLPISIITETDFQSTPLVTACECGNAYAVERLLEHGANPNKRVPGGFTALEAVYSTNAGRNARFEIIPLLIAHGADLEIRETLVTIGHASFQEIRLATDETAQQSIELLRLYSDAPETMTDYSGATLLGKCQSPMVAAWLIGEGADVDAANTNGKTPLMYAVETGNREIVELLIQNGADRTLKNDAGKTACDIACENGFDDLVEILSP